MDLDTGNALVSVAVGVVGYVSGYLTARWRGQAALDALTVKMDQEDPMDDTPDRRPRGPRGPTPGALALVILLAAAMLVGFGIQQSVFQEEIRERDTCYAAWGEDVVSTLDTRFARGTRPLEKAAERREDALDGIILFIIAERDREPPAPPEDADRRFGKVLEAFAVAKAHKDAVEEQVRKTRSRNTFSPPDCD